MKKPSDLSRFHPDTQLVLAGRDPARFDGAINPPVHRASTIQLECVDDLYGKPNRTYALEGMAVQDALCAALIAIEGGTSATLAPSGLAACTLALMTFAEAGGELLVTDSVYGPTRRFCDRVLNRLGVTTRYFDPHIGAGIEELISDKTRAIMLESPGSLTFEVQDVSAITQIARAKGVVTVIDNTWSAGVYFKPFAHGVDVSVQALTKYQAGHADVFMGAVLSKDNNLGARVRATYKELGLGASPDDAYLVLRGLRSLSARLERQSASALRIAAWLEQRPGVARVVHPGLASCADHTMWKRDFTGASGVFGVVLKPVASEMLARMLEGYGLFAMGFSWGGYESLILPCDPQIVRTAKAWRAEGPLLRLSIGLEHPDDLIADLEAGFARLSGSTEA